MLLRTMLVPVTPRAKILSWSTIGADNGGVCLLVRESLTVQQYIAIKVEG